MDLLFYFLFFYFFGFHDSGVDGGGGCHGQAIPVACCAVNFVKGQ